MLWSCIKAKFSTFTHLQPFMHLGVEHGFALASEIETPLLFHSNLLLLFAAYRFMIRLCQVVLTVSFVL